MYHGWSLGCPFTSSDPSIRVWQSARLVLKFPTLLLTCRYCRCPFSRHYCRFAQMIANTRLGPSHRNDRLVWNKLLSQSIHCRIRKYSNQHPINLSRSIRIIPYEKEWDTIAIWTMFPRTEYDWSREFWISCEFEMGVAVDGWVTYGMSSRLTRREVRNQEKIACWGTKRADGRSTWLLMLDICHLIPYQALNLDLESGDRCSCWHSTSSSLSPSESLYFLCLDTTRPCRFGPLYSLAQLQT